MSFRNVSPDTDKENTRVKMVKMLDRITIKRTESGNRK